MEPDRAGVEAGDLEQVLDQALEAVTSLASRSSAAWARSGISSRRASSTSTRRRQRHQRRAQLVADVGGEAGVALDRAAAAPTAMSLNELARRQVGVVGRLEAGVEAAAGDRLGGLRRVGDGRTARRAANTPSSTPSSGGDDAGAATARGATLRQRAARRRRARRTRSTASTPRAAGCRRRAPARRRRRRSSAPASPSSITRVARVDGGVCVAARSWPTPDAYHSSL